MYICSLYAFIFWWSLCVLFVLPLIQISPTTTWSSCIQDPLVGLDCSEPTFGDVSGLTAVGWEWWPSATGQFNIHKFVYLLILFLLFMLKVFKYWIKNRGITYCVGTCASICPIRKFEITCTSYVHWSLQDLDCVEFFCGVASIVAGFRDWAWETSMTVNCFDWKFAN